MKMLVQGMGATATSVSVFAAFVVLYFAAVAVKAREVGWVAQATSITGAVATYLTMSQRQFAIVPSLGILGFMVIVWALATMPSREPLPAHAQVFSAAFMGGTAAYVTSVAATAVGLPVWAAVVATIVAAPVFLAYVLPHAADHIETVFERQT